MVAVSDSQPTLSVGVAIGHCLDPLEDLLRYAKHAQKSAKSPDRNGLAVHLHPRSGTPVFVREQWNVKHRVPLDQRLEESCDLFVAELISNRVPFELRDLAMNYAGWPPGVTTHEAIQRDIQLILFKKRPGGRKMDSNTFQQRVEPMLQNIAESSYSQRNLPKQYHSGIVSLANEWLIARHIARAVRQASGNRP
jgi:CRISPR-associated protein Cmr2